MADIFDRVDKIANLALLAGLGYFGWKVYNQLQSGAFNSGKTAGQSEGYDAGSTQANKNTQQILDEKATNDILGYPKTFIKDNQQITAYTPQGEASLISGGFVLKSQTPPAVTTSTAGGHSSAPSLSAFSNSSAVDAAIKAAQGSKNIVTSVYNPATGWTLNKNEKGQTVSMTKG